MKKVQEDVAEIEWDMEDPSEDQTIQTIITWFKEQQKMGATHVYFRSYYGKVQVTAYKMRPETKEEVSNRKKWESEERRRMKEHELEQLAKLKAKYEK